MTPPEPSGTPDTPRNGADTRRGGADATDVSDGGDADPDGDANGVDVVVLADTHRATGTGLAGRAADAVAAADRVLHAGDLTTASVLEAFQAASEAFHAVHGNADTAAVRDRLPDHRVLAVGPLRVAVVHRRDGGTTGLALFGRSVGADLVCFGHTHRPAVERTGDVLLCNPGSHADPRGGPATHLELAVGGDAAAVTGALRERDGGVVERFEYGDTAGTGES